MTIFTCNCRSPEWQFIPDEEKENLGLTFEADGEFWMSYKDFSKYWTELEICNLSPDSLDDSPVKWEVASFEGSWIAGESAGGCRNYVETFASNPQFIITLEVYYKMLFIWMIFFKIDTYTCS